MRYAQVENCIVDNIIESETDPDGINGEWVACGNAGPGWVHNGGGSFSPPGAAEDIRIWKIYTGSFKDRFDSLGYPGLKGLLIGLGRTNDVCYAAFGDLVGRDYVDLLARRGELLAVFAAMAEVVAAAGKPEFTLAMQHAILETMTVESERYVKGLQP